MSNRVKKGRVTAKSMGQAGVDVVREDGKITLACFDQRSAFSVTWSLAETRRIVELLVDGLEEPDKKVDVVRESGLIVPAAGQGKLVSP
jgi:hypothetical protein